MADDSSETRFLSMTCVLSLECALKVLHDSEAVAAQQNKNDARRERPEAEVQARAAALPPIGTPTGSRIADSFAVSKPKGANRCVNKNTLMTAVKQALLYKTEWCNKVQCTYKERCQFCHPGEKLRARPSPDFLRLKLDEAYLKHCADCA